MGCDLPIVQRAAGRYGFDMRKTGELVAVFLTIERECGNVRRLGHQMS
jgi:hypothetical protein